MPLLSFGVPGKYFILFLTSLIFNIIKTTEKNEQKYKINCKKHKIELFNVIFTKYNLLTDLEQEIC